MFNVEVDEREIPARSDDLLTALVELDRLTAYVTAAVGHFDTLKLWDGDDAASMIAWLCDRARYDRRSAIRLVRHAKKLAGLPVTTTAWKTGLLSGGQVNTIVANLTDKTTPLFADAEPELVPTLVPLSTAETETVMGAWKAAAETVVETEPDDDLGQVRLSRSLGGRRHLNGSLSAEDGETVETALRSLPDPTTRMRPERALNAPMMRSSISAAGSSTTNPAPPAAVTARMSTSSKPSTTFRMVARRTRLPGTASTDQRPGNGPVTPSSTGSSVTGVRRSWITGCRHGRSRPHCGTRS